MRAIPFTSLATRSGMRSIFAALVAVGAALALAVTSARADVTLATGLPSTVKVTMKGDTVAWSAPTTGGRWKLVIRRRGVTADAAVAPGRAPFDVDLGDDGHGRLIATYSRCSVPAVGFERPRGCDVYRYDVTARRERRVPGLGAGSASDYLPTASAGRIAFARSVGGGPAKLYRRSLDGGALTALPGGLRNSDPRTGPRSLDLGPRSLAIAWVARGPAAPYYDYGAQEVRVDLLRGGSRLLARYAQGNVSGTDVVGVSAIDNGGVLWGAQGNGEDGRSRLYLVPNYEESSDSRYLTFPLTSVSGTTLDRAVALTCSRMTETATDCSIVLLSAA
jgi:hypothetical protein